MPKGAATLGQENRYNAPLVGSSLGIPVGPVDPIIEEPIRPLLPNSADPSFNSPMACGPMDATTLGMALLLLEFVPGRRTRRQLVERVREG